MSVGPPGGGPDRRAVSPLPLRGARSGADPGRPCPCRTDRRRCQLEGCGAVRVGPSTLRRQLGQHEVPDRQRRAAATPRGYRAERGHPPCIANHQLHLQDGLVPLCCHRRARTRSSWRLACQSGRLGPDTVGPARHGPARAWLPRPPHRDPHHLPCNLPGHWPAYPGTHHHHSQVGHCHSQVTRTQPRRRGPPGTGRIQPS